MELLQDALGAVYSGGIFGELYFRHLIHGGVSAIQFTIKFARHRSVDEKKFDIHYHAKTSQLSEEMVAVIPCVLIGPNCHPFRQLWSRAGHVTWRVFVPPFHIC
jgi:hypothetical protein